MYFTIKLEMQDESLECIYELQLITIFFGANDICSAQCFNPEHFSPLRYAHHLRRTLDYLKFVLPRTLVNVVPAIGNI